MGYNSSYGLTVYDINTKQPISGDEFHKIATSVAYEPTGERDDEDEVDSPFDQIDNGWAGGYSKWYDMEECLIEASLIHPTVVFVLDVEGEDQGDVYRLVANNGVGKSWHRPVIDPPDWEDIL
jgi:hypothetical protein